MKEANAVINRKVAGKKNGELFITVNGYLLYRGNGNIADFQMVNNMNIKRLKL